MTNHGKKPNIARLPHPGDVIDERYRLREAFATGGMGIIMKAEQLRTGRDVAVKLLHPHIANSTDFAARFKREAKVATLFDHASIVRVYDVGQTEQGALYLVMEFLVGEELKEIIRREAPLPAGRAADIGLQMLDGLAEAHSQGVVHRDIKPSNVFICKTRRGEDKVKLLDFGVAKLVNSTETQVTKTGSITGTPSYIAPEAMVEKGATNKKAADVYAAGLVILEMLTGKRAFEGNGLAQTLLQHIKKPVMLPEVIADLPLGDVIRRATAKHPDDRYVDADEMYIALKEVRSTIPDDLIVEKGASNEPTTQTSTNLLEQIYEKGDQGGLEVLRQLPQHESMPSRPALPDLPGRAGRSNGTPSARISGAISSEIPVDDFDAGPTKIMKSGSESTEAPTPRHGVPKPTATPTSALNDPFSSSVPSSDAREDGSTEMAFPAGGGNKKLIIAGAAVAVLAVAIVAMVLIFGGDPDDSQDADDAELMAEVTPTEASPDENDDSEDPGSDSDVATGEEDEEEEQEMTTRVRVDSEPTGATVFAGSEMLGRTAFEFDFDPLDLPDELRIEKDGYEEAVLKLSGDDEEHVVVLEEQRREAAEPSSPPQPTRERPPAPAEPTPTPTPTSNPSPTPSDTETATEAADEEDDEKPSDVDSLIDRHLFAD